MHSMFLMRKKACCRFGTRTELRAWITICHSSASYPPLSLAYKVPQEQENKPIVRANSLLGTRWFPPSLTLLRPMNEALSFTSRVVHPVQEPTSRAVKERTHRAVQGHADLKDLVAQAFPFTFYLCWNTGPDKLNKTPSLRNRALPTTLPRRQSLKGMSN